MLLLLVLAVRVPGAAGTGGGAHRNTGGEAEEAAVRSAASGSGVHVDTLCALAGLIDGRANIVFSSLL